MQEISFKNILKLIGPDKVITEADDEFSYKDFKARHAEYFKSTGSAEGAYVEIIKNYLFKYIPPIEFVSEGSSRGAFMLQGGKCLKIAMNQRGLAQNEAEIQTAFESKLPCFSQIYDYAGDFTSILTECCVPLDTQELVNRIMKSDVFDKKIGLENFHQFRGTIWMAYTSGYDIEAARQNAESIIKKYRFSTNKNERLYMHDTQVQYNFYCSMLENTHPTSKIMKTLMDFCKQHPDALQVGDIMCSDNWGLAIREKHLTPILLDSGLSKAVLDTHYQNLNKYGY